MHRYNYCSKSSILLYVLMIFALAGYAQTCDLNLRGTVTDFHNGDPLVGAVIKIQNAEKFASTDLEGRYILSNLCAGDIEIEITHISCSTLRKTISLSQSATQNFRLEHHLDALDEVVVIEHIHDRSCSAPEAVLTDEQLENYLGSPMGEALEDLSGVTAFKTGAAVIKPVIHGLAGSRIAIVKNGTRMESQQWGVEHAPVTDLNSTSVIRVVKGGTALRYGGDAVGGTIIMEPARPLATDTVSARAFLTAQSNGRGGATGARVIINRKSGWYGHVAGSYTRFGDYEAPDYVLSNTANASGAASLTAGYRSFKWGFSSSYDFYTAEIGVLRSSHLGNVSDLVRGINSQEPLFIRDFTYDINEPRQQVAHHTAKISAFRRISGFGKLSADYALQYNQRLEYDIRRGGRNDQAALDLDLTTHDLNLHMDVERFDDFELSFGTDLYYQTNYPDPATGVRRLIPDYDRYMVGAYAGIEYPLSRKLILDAGARYDYDRMDAQKFYQDGRWEALGYDEDFEEFEVRDAGNQIFTNPVFNYHNLAATIGATQIVRQEGEKLWDLSANLSHAVRSPNPSELFSDGVHQALASIELGDLRLEQERASKLAIGTHLATDKTDIQATVYANYITDFILLIPNGIESTIRGPFPVYQYTSTDALISGIDLDYTQLLADRDRWSASATIKTSYIYGQNLDREEPLINMPAPRAAIALGWAEKSNHAYYVKLRSDLVGFQNRFPDYDYNVDFLNEDGTRESREVNISRPPDVYALLGLTAGGSFQIQNTTLDIRLTATNLLDTEYRDYLNRQRFFAAELGRSISISLILNF